MSLSCPACLAWISEYVDGELEPPQAAAVEDHLRACARCSSVLASTRQMLKLVADERYCSLPEGAGERLRLALEQGLGEPLLPAQLRAAAPAPAPPPRRSWLGFGAATAHLRATAWAAAVVLILLAVGLARWRTSVVTASGWLIDQHCFAAYQSQHRVAEHARSCLLRCAASTYGLVDAQGHFRPFDANGNRSALAAVQASTKPDHLWVTVQAKRSDSSMLEVEDLKLTDPSEATTSARY